MADAGIEQPKPPQEARFTNEVRPDWVPAAPYYEPAYVEAEKENLWPKVWLIACREEEIPNVGDYVNFEIANESFLITRTATDEVKSFYNVCRHRGRRLKEGKAGHVSDGFVCRFHFWAWDLDGGIRRVIAPDNWEGCPNFDDAELSLQETRIEKWAGWYWISMDPDIEPLIDYLGVIPDVMKNYELEDMRFAWYKTLIAPCNWKVVADAFNEGYHAQGTHPQVGARLPWETLTVAHGKHAMFFHPAPGVPYKPAEEPPAGTDNRKHNYLEALKTRDTLHSLVSEHRVNAAKEAIDALPEDATLADAAMYVEQNHRRVLEESGARWPENLTREDIQRAGTDWHIFPNTIFLPSIDSILWYRMRPNGDDPGSCIFDIWCLERFAEDKVPPLKRDFYPTLESFAGQNPFLEQDFSNIAAVQQGMKSRSFQALRTSPVQELTVSNFHRVYHDYLQK